MRLTLSPVTILGSGLTPEFTLDVSGKEVVECFTPHDQTSVAICAEDDGWPGDGVVVGPHRMPVCAGNRSCQKVTDLGVSGNLRLSHENV